MRLGVFGGSFDPPHNGHLALCLYARDLLDLDLLIISVSKNPFKAPSDAPDEDRAAMAQLLADEINATGAIAAVSRWELEQPGSSYTVELLRHMKRLYPVAERVFLAGEDSYRQMPRWKSYEDIPALCRIAVFGRPGIEHGGDDSGAPLPQAEFHDFDMPVSATDVRTRIASGIPVLHLVPSPIAEYIADRGIYHDASA
ncbi:MAG: nicotinate (nicotinamide) nucleotide adenylyltransferase [Chlorobiaceae bacterium]|nr:nicotinate (nicotinamide) nucleotide adenylyltransferase [Chlorobiaceae bacterium]